MTATSLPHVLPRALTVSQAAEYWGLSSNTFRKLARTGISYQPDADRSGMFRVAYPDSSLSADCYNLVRVKQHWRDVAMALYPRRLYEQGDSRP